jgi:hypothetical protein
MADTPIVQYWPTEVPDQLWNFDLLHRPPDFPKMGVSFEPQFFWAFLAGFVVVGVFAWKRFEDKTFDPTSFEYRVLTELKPTKLRGGSAMRRAYLIYAGTLLVLYLLMTFFGKLILQTLSALPIVGPQIDTGGLDFSSAQWPLLLAFGLAGLGPLVPPLPAFETWLRRRAHQAVGIPTRIDQLARRITDNMDRLQREAEAAAAAAAAAAVEAGEAAPPAPKIGVETAEPNAAALEWAAAQLGGHIPLRRVENLRRELEQFRDWSDEEDPDWPNRSVRSDLRALERKVAAEIRDTLREYGDVLCVKRHPTGGSATDQERRKHLRARLQAATARMTQLRRDMAAVIIVYGEGDRSFDRVRNPLVRTALKKTFSFMQIRSGPEMGLAVAVLAVFGLNALACALGYRDFIRPAALSAEAVLITATIESFRFAAIFTLPIAGAFGLRFYLLDRLSAERHDSEATPRLSPWGLLGADALAVTVALAALGLVAMLAAAVIATNSSHFQILLTRSGGSFLVYYMQQATLVAILVPLALIASDRQRDGARIELGLLAAAVTVAYLAWFYASVFQGLKCKNGEPFFLSGIFDKECFGDNAGLDFLIYPAFAFLMCAVFGSMPQGKPAVVTTPTVTSTTGVPSAVTGALILAALLAMAGPVHASGDCTEGAQGPNPCDIVIGFRDDAEPFSYKVETDGRPLYEGYVADLCYALFNGSDYRVKSESVTVGDRFDNLRGNGSTKAPQVDMLCDPLTLRFDRMDESIRGFFSPIVFASGVSYLARMSSLPRRDAYVRYAENSTAEKVAKLACEADVLRLRMNGDAPGEKECEPLPYCDRGKPKLTADPKTRNTDATSRYHLCPMKSHADLIAWFCRTGRAEGPDGREKEEVPDGHMVYFGDREIIQGKLAAYPQQPGHTCPPRNAILPGVSNYTYEPYALLVSVERPELAQFVQRRTYEFFSRPANPRNLFQKYFKGQQMSPALAYLYLLNGVGDRDVFTFETTPDSPGPPPDRTADRPAADTRAAAPEPTAPGEHLLPAAAP